jgi:exodeoxyribonuclease V beta subunit
VPPSGTTSPLVRLDFDEKDKVQKLFHGVLVHAESAERRLLRQHQASTFDSVVGDLITDLWSRPDEVRTRVGDQFKLVVIDEFQDTDIGQWFIFEQLFRRGVRRVPLLLVGDPKQAIFSFRGGDVTVMQRVMAEVQASKDLAYGTLRMNRRSHQGLLNALNDFYGPEDAPHEFTPASGSGQAAIVYETVEAADELPGVFVLRQMIEGYEARQPTNEKVAIDVGQEILRLTTGNYEGFASADLEGGKERWSYADITVLARTKHFLKTVQQEMEYRGIPYITPKSISVFDSLAATQVRMLVWALADQSDVRRWNSLAISWFGSIVSTSSAAEAYSLLWRYGVGALHRLVTGGEYVQHMRALQYGDRHITDVDHLFEAMATEFPDGVAAGELLDWLEAAIKDAEDADDDVDGQRRIASDLDAVRLMTIHSAKGLEFPVVLLPQPESAAKDPKLIVQHGMHGDQAVRVLDLSSVGKPADSRTADVRPENTQESDRLIYVALTRAKSLLVAWRTHTQSAKNAPAWLALTAGVQPDVKDGPRVVSVRVDEAAGLFAPTHASALRDIRVLRAPRVEVPLRRWSYSTLHDASSPDGEREVNTASEAEDDGSGDQREKRGRLGYRTFGDERGTSLGDAVHGVFEHTVGLIDASDVTRLDQVVRDEYARQGVSVHDGATALFQRLLTYDLGAPLGHHSLNDYVGASRRVASEMRFTLPLHGGDAKVRDVLHRVAELAVHHDPDGPFAEYFAHSFAATVPNRLAQGFLSGSIDLVLPTLEGDLQFLLLDYKTNALRVTDDFRPSSLRKEMMLSGYPLQALLYSVALHRHLTTRLVSYRPEQHLGGATYFYVRGAGMREASSPDGLCHWAIPSALTVAVSALFASTSAAVA